MEPEHKLYLYGGSTFILVPESAWLDAMKAEPTGVTVRKSVEDVLFLKGWTKVKETRDPDSSSATTIDWIYEETGAKATTVVNNDGQLKFNGKPIGTATVGETFKVLQKMAEDARLVKQNWVNPSAEVHDKLKDAKDKGVGSNPIKKPEEKGGPSPMCDVMSSTAIANMQLIGKYDPLIAKDNLSVPERMQKIQLLMELAEKEENEQEQQRLLEQVDRELDLVENAAGQTLGAGLKTRTGDDTI